MLLTSVSNDVDGRLYKANKFKRVVDSIIMIVNVNKMCSEKTLRNWVLWVFFTKLTNRSDVFVI